LEGKGKNKIVACGKSDLTTTMSTRSAAVDMAVKWRLKPRTRIESAYKGFLWNFLIKKKETR
jgi:hypothetical protein